MNAIMKLTAVAIGAIGIAGGAALAQSPSSDVGTNHIGSSDTDTNLNPATNGTMSSDGTLTRAHGKSSTNAAPMNSTTNSAASNDSSSVDNSATSSNASNSSLSPRADRN